MRKKDKKDRISKFIKSIQFIRQNEALNLIFLKEFLSRSLEVIKCQKLRKNAKVRLHQSAKVYFGDGENMKDFLLVLKNQPFFTECRFRHENFSNLFLIFFWKYFSQIMSAFWNTKLFNFNMNSVIMNFRTWLAPWG